MLDALLGRRPIAMHGGTVYESDDEFEPVEPPQRRNSFDANTADMAEFEAASSHSFRDMLGSLSVESGHSWSIPSNEIKLERIIGRGSNHVVVHKATWKEVIDVAVKVIPKVECTTSELENLGKEVKVLMRMSNHPAVLHFYGVCEDAISYKLVMEYCERGSLMDWIKKARSRPAVMQQQLNWPRRLDIALRVAEGMACLHVQHVLHRDLKSPNVLLTARMDVKVADFGFSRFTEDCASACASINGPTNLRWLPPEVLDEGEDGKTRWTPAADIYGYGVILWELLTLELPYSDMDNIKLMVRCRSAEGLQLPIPAPDKVPGGTFSGLEDFLALMRSCLAKKPKERPESFKVIIDRLKQIRMADAVSRRNSSQASTPAGGISAATSAATAGAGAVGPITPAQSRQPEHPGASQQAQEQQPDHGPAAQQQRQQQPEAPPPNSLPAPSPGSGLHPALQQRTSSAGGPPTPPLRPTSPSSGGVQPAPAQGYRPPLLRRSMQQSTLPRHAEMEQEEQRQQQVQDAQATGAQGEGHEATMQTPFVQPGEMVPPQGERFPTIRGHEQSRNRSYPPPAFPPVSSSSNAGGGGAMGSGSSTTARYSDGRSWVSAADGSDSSSRRGSSSHIAFSDYRGSVLQGQRDRDQVGSSRHSYDSSYSQGQEEEEYRRAITKMLRWFKQMDIDRSGAIDQSELAKGMDALTDDTADDSARETMLIALLEEFSECDLNGDGTVDAAEFLVLNGRLLRTQYASQGKVFDVQVYEKECQAMLAAEMSMVGAGEAAAEKVAREGDEVSVYRGITQEYVCWFKELDCDKDRKLSLMEVRQYIIQEPDDSQMDQFHLMLEVHDRFADYDSNSDGYLNRHDYLHLCARILTEEHHRQGFPDFDEEMCRYQLYYHVLDDGNGVEYDKILKKGIKAIGWPPYSCDPRGPVRILFAQKAAQVKSCAVGSGTYFNNKDFTRLLRLMALALGQTHVQRPGRR